MNRTIENEMKTATANKHDNGQEAKSFAELLDEYQYPRPERGKFLVGKIIRIADDVIFIDVGAKRDAIVPHGELRQLGDDFLGTLAKGDEVPVYVTHTPEGDQELIVSLERGLEQQDWDRAEQLQAKDETLELEVTGYNKGGLLVDFNRLQGFVPNSRVPDLKHIRDPDKRRSFSAKKIGTTLPLKIVEIDREQQRLVLSAAEAQKELRRQQLEDLQEGQVVTGRVVNLVKYGAFIDLGYVSGLLHVSKIDWRQVDHPADVLSVGDEIEAIVESVDVERERVGLSRQALLPTPWERFAEEHEVGDLLAGEVTTVLDFGAFVRVPSEVEGLVHVSEMDGGSPESVFQPGDQVLVRVITIEPDQQRIGLSTRRVTTAEEIEWMARQPGDGIAETAAEELA